MILNRNRGREGKTVFNASLKGRQVWSLGDFLRLCLKSDFKENKYFSKWMGRRHLQYCPDKGDKSNYWKIFLDGTIDSVV